MRQQKKKSQALTKAEHRIAGLQAINPELDLGYGYTVADYRTLTEDLRNKIAAYNQAQIMVNITKSELAQAERTLNNYSEYMLLGVAARYGKDSSEYGMAGGTRKSQRKKRRPAVKKTAISAE
ncbi:hypothetical protein [Calothrix sp. NIES-2098]|uniref:hypothetical protein n=1 Tax=Calothrix sp. NIES-2098 TaxID=1954171 RepID=UPI000B62324B|nr:hypothetical protein NIES2098_30730 [Calothrix sp. NIES-2098]